VNALLDSIPLNEVSDEVWPVIVAAGKGTRSFASGLTVPKPLASIGDTPAIVHVLRNIRTAFGKTRQPIVIVSPETEGPIQTVIRDDVSFVVQPKALGTGDAVLCAYEQMKGFQGRALVVWSTQPVIQPQTIRRTFTLSTLFENYEMVFPTTVKDKPYAPVLRDKDGRVQGAKETHLEQARPMDCGETNIGMFMVKAASMFKALIELKELHWNDREMRYQLQGGELGFPNELIKYFAQKTAVFACPIADAREEQGIKELGDVSRCEQFISELAVQASSDRNSREADEYIAQANEGKWQ
jgi:bifunctional N-acetylglucosamine-1-phosphate-uridyltransferase/glucosamine-1-phosphate-acetyltransferase GlmU-like protein